MRSHFRLLTGLTDLVKAALEKLTPGKKIVLRRAVAEDGQFIFELCLEQADKGHFNGDYSDPRVQAGLAQQISCAIGDAPVPMPGLRNGAGAAVWVLMVGVEPVGFAMLLEDRPKSWNEKVELFMVALRDDFQGHGLGKLMVTRLLSGVQSRLIYARCRRPSTRMKALLEGKGFKNVDVSKMGTTTLELRR